MEDDVIIFEYGCYDHDYPYLQNNDDEEYYFE